MGFLSRNQPAFDPARDLPDLSGKVMIVTGGNSGIGFTTVQHLARRGAKVYLGARSETRGKEAIERLHAEGLEPGNGQVVCFTLNLSDPHDAKKSAQSFFEKEKRIDVLINNAGGMPDTCEKDSNGVIESMIVNFLSPMVFTNTLLPLLTQSAQDPKNDIRIVFVSSHAMSLLASHNPRFRNIDDLNEEFSGMTAKILRYGKSKLATLLYAKELQRKLDTDGIPITVLSLHPGAVYTEAVMKHSIMKTPVIGIIAGFIVRQIFLTPSEGALASVFAAASPTVKTERDKYKGGFLYPKGELKDVPTPQANDKELAQEAMATAETLLKQWGV